MTFHTGVGCMSISVTHCLHRPGCRLPELTLLNAAHFRHASITPGHTRRT
jgi:hypothetical protein